MNSISLIKIDSLEFLFYLGSVSVLARKLCIPFPSHSLCVCGIFIVLLLLFLISVTYFLSFSP